MSKPQMIGTINGFVLSNAKIGRRSFQFDGTTKGLVNAARNLGAGVGSKIKADFGGGFRVYVIEAAPGDDRCNGMWATRL